MTFRKISANYIYPGNGEVIKNSIIITGQDGTIIEILKNQDFSSEQEGLELYNGIVCPGFINAFCKLEPNSLSRARQIELYMFKNGIVAAGDVSTNLNKTFFKNGRFIFYKDISGSNVIERTNIDGVYLITGNENKLKCIGTGVDLNNSDLSLKGIIQNFIENYKGETFIDLIQFLCFNGAIAMGIENWAGTLEIGKKPGINLISGINPFNLKHSLDLTVKKLV